MSDEDGDIDEDKPETLAIEKSPASAGGEQKKKKLKKGGLIEDMGGAPASNELAIASPKKA